MLYISLKCSDHKIIALCIDFIRSSVVQANGNGPWMCTTEKTPSGGYFELVYFFLAITNLLNGKWKQIGKVY